MKAIILAGGSGTRLRPLTSECPKPMALFFGRPLLEHLLLLLRKNGVTEAAVTLCYQPETIERYFGNGSGWGMRLHWVREEQPRGTAGAVRACLNWLAGEREVLVLSGDALCDFDLQSAAEFHRKQEAAATILLHQTDTPQEYGLVQTDEEGRVLRFLEKPGWGQVFTNQVSTGIYVLSASLLRTIPPDAPCDFGRELFPSLLKAEKPLFGFRPSGCWRDIGDCGAYLRALKDCLDGKIRLDIGQPRLRDGVWSGTELPKGVTLIPPCYLGRNITLAEGALIGPHTVLEDGSSVGPRAVMQGSAVLGASVGAGAAVTGGILCPESAVKAGAVLNRGTVLGPGATVERSAILRQNVKIWPGLRVETGARLNASLTGAESHGIITFTDGGTLTGTAGLDLTPELLMTLGSLLGSEGKVGLGCYGGTAAQSLAMAAAAGISAAGGTAALHDASIPAAAAWLGGYSALPHSLFLAQSGERLTVYLYDRFGLPLSAHRRRRLERELLRGVIRRAPPEKMGCREELTGVDQAYRRAAIRCSGSGPVRPMHLRLPGRSRSSALLREALTELGMRPTGEAAVPAFAVTEDGRALFGRDEEGRPIPAESMLLLTIALLLERGERRIGLPEDAPIAAERLILARGGQLLRLGREECRARERAPEQTALHDGVFAACLICRHLAESGQTLSALLERLPACAVKRAEVPLRHGRGHVMEQLNRCYPEAERTGAGIRLRFGGGSVFLAPRSRYSALKIFAEAAETEAAAELCDFIRNRVRELDSL